MTGFLVEKITEIEEQFISRDNRLLIRLWTHADWSKFSSNPLEQQTISGRVGLITLLKEQLGKQFEKIEQENRNKALVAFQETNLSDSPVISSPPPTLDTAPTTPDPIPAEPDTYPQPTYPPSSAKSKTWIWVAISLIVVLSIFIIVWKNTKQRLVDDTNTTQPTKTVHETAENEVDKDTELNEVGAANKIKNLKIIAKKPPIMVGMQWHSKTIDYRDPKNSFDDVVYKITANKDGLVYVDKTISARKDNKVTLIYNESLNLVGGKTGSYAPALTYYDFPLVEGKTWDVSSKVTGNKYKDLQRSTGKVIGKEIVSTPMGKVETIKVIVNLNTYLDGKEISKGQDILWYSPKFGRSVQTEETYWDNETRSWVLGYSHRITSVKMP